MKLKLLVEVKPKKQAQPQKPKRQTKKFLNEAKTYLTNQQNGRQRRFVVEKVGHLKS